MVKFLNVYSAKERLFVRQIIQFGNNYIQFGNKLFVLNKGLVNSVSQRRGRECLRHSLEISFFCDITNSQKKWLMINGKTCRLLLAVSCK